MKVRAIALALAVLLCLGPFTCAQDTQKAPESTAPDTQKAPAPDSTTGVDSNTPAASQDTSAPPATSDNAPPAAPSTGKADKSKTKDVKPGSKDDVNAIGNRPMGGKGLGNWYSLEKEIRMGKEYAMQVEQSVKLVQDPVVNEYVNRVGQNLVRNSDA